MRDPRTPRSRKLLAPLVLALLAATLVFASSALASSCSKQNPCTAAFVATLGPADAALNGAATSENITSQPYDPDGAALQVLVKDSSGSPRGGVSITLQLSPNQGSLSGPVTAISDSNGLATFPGTSANPVTINKLGLSFTMTPTGSNVIGTASGEFGIYREGEPCATGQPCVVQDLLSDTKLGGKVTSSDTGTLGVLVRAFSIDCAGYSELSSSEIAWKFTGTGAQTVTAIVSKALSKQVLDRGSSHLDVCFQTDPGKAAFTDKSGNSVNTGLLADCNQTITTNCILSETAAPGGGRLITFTVEDGKGRI
jgi:hypothetical protein